MMNTSEALLKHYQTVGQQIGIKAKPKHLKQIQIAAGAVAHMRLIHGRIRDSREVREAFDSVLREFCKYMSQAYESHEVAVQKSKEIMPKILDAAVIENFNADWPHFKAYTELRRAQ